MDDIPTRKAKKILKVGIRWTQLILKRCKTVRMCECGVGQMVNRKEVLKVKKEIEKYKNKRRKKK